MTDQELPTTRPLPDSDASITFIRTYERPGEAACSLGVFSIDQRILLLSVSGRIKEEDATELITLYRESSLSTGGERPLVILDFSHTEHVGYQARKRVLLAIHILRAKSQHMWVIGSQYLRNLMDMHQKMYPDTDKPIIHSLSLEAAFRDSLQLARDLATSNTMEDHTPSQGSYTQQKQIRSDEHLQQLRAILNSAPDPIISLTRDGHLVDTNDAGRAFYQKILGCEFTPGTHLLTNWPVTTADHWPRLHANLLAGESWSRQLEIPGESVLKFFLITLTPVPGSQQNISSISLFIKDITKTKLVEREARYQKELIDSISYSIQEGLFRSSPQKGIMFVNQAFVEMFGYDSVEEVLDLDPYALYVDTSRRDDFVNIIKDQDSFINEKVHFQRKDGSTFWGLISSVKKIEHDMVYHDGAIRDVTQLRETQHRLQEKNQELTQTNEELHKVNKELDAFVYRVSHDLRAPLVSMLGLISISRLEQKREKRERYLELMEKSIRRLDEFILDIMNYSRNTRTEVRSDDVALKSLIDQLIEDLRYSQQGHISITSDVPAELRIRTDAQRLQPILNNLLSNSIRYMDEKKADRWVIITAIPHKKGVMITVEDNGIGIEQEHQEKIFSMFYRASRQSEGSGIGLYIVQETVEKLHGSIELDSVSGEGTTFRIYLPDSPETYVTPS